MTWRSRTCSARATTTRRWATARRTNGRIRRGAVPALAPKPLSRCRVALITTAAPYQSDKGDQGPGAAYNAGAKFYTVYSGDTALEHDLRIAHVAIDRQHTTAEDPGQLFPAGRSCAAAAQAGRIGSLAPRFHGAPTNRSQRATLEVDGPEIVARCQADGADAAILVANCPVCHQTLSLVARLLEASGIATVVMGCAKDIVEHVGVPRLLFSDFPLGNAAGRPQRCAVAGADAGTGVAIARVRTGRAQHAAVAAALERQRRIGSSTTATSRACRRKKLRCAGPTLTPASRRPRPCGKGCAERALLSPRPAPTAMGCRPPASRCRCSAGSTARTMAAVSSCSPRKSFNASATACASWMTRWCGTFITAMCVWAASQASSLRKLLLEGPLQHQRVRAGLSFALQHRALAGQHLVDRAPHEHDAVPQ